MLQKLSTAIAKGLEDYFYSHGVWIAHHPKKTIAVTLVLVSLCGIGLIWFHEEKNMVKLWIPQDTDFARNNQWLWENYPPDVRFHSLIFEHDDNVLTPEVVQQMLEIYKDVYAIRTQNGRKWSDMCVKLPVVDVPGDSGSSLSKRRRRKKRNDQDSFFDGFKDNFEDTDVFSDDDFEAIKSGAGLGVGFDPSVALYPDGYCPIVESMSMACFETSLLEMFAIRGKITEESESEIENLTTESLLYKINNLKTSGLFLQPRNFTEYLGGITRDDNGQIIGAKATTMRWFGRANSTEIELERQSNIRKDLGMDQQPVDQTTLEFELKLKEVLDDRSDYPEGLDSRANVQRSFGDISTGAIWDDVNFLIIGFVLIYGFVQAMLGRFNRVEQRAFLGAIGITSCGFAALVSFGICSAVGLDYGPMHSIIPCLFIGLGVDDMFIIVQSLNNCNKEDSESDKKRPLPQRIGRALKVSGVGITITSFTDILVFAIGGTTVLPSLRSYSLYTAVGIFATYLIQITYFVAWLSIDQKRIDDHRDGMFCCLRHGDDWKPNECSQKDLLTECFNKLGTLLSKLPVKVFVLAFTALLFGFGLWGTCLLRVEFRYLDFLPTTSSLYQWFSLHTEYFPSNGEMGTVFFTGGDIHNNLNLLKDLDVALRSNPIVISSVSSWYHDFELYVEQNFLKESESLTASNISKTFFHEKLSQFLFSPTGAKYMEQFDFNDKIKCGKPAPDILLFSFNYVHRQFTTSAEYISAMNWVKDQVESLEYPGRAFAMAQAYSRWEIDEVIGQELVRNLALAIACVSLVMLVLIANLLCSFFVILCVVITLVDVCGAMHFWGLTVDIVASTNVIISVGLCVDFSAHIAHYFMLSRGSKDERMKKTLGSLGPAVFNGGISTLIAVLILANSQSHVFLSYFKVFFLMITLGLFHGLIFLPVLLSICGPRAYKYIREQSHLTTAKIQPNEPVFKEANETLLTTTEV